MLAEQQLVQHNYPRKLADDTWKETQPHDPANKSHIYALDCEFCKAGTQSVLTRISLIDFQGEVVLMNWLNQRKRLLIMLLNTQV